MPEETQTVSDAVAPQVSTEAPQAPSFNAKYDIDTLISNAPEDVDREALSKYLAKTADPYASFKNYSNIEKMKSKGLPNESWSDDDYATLDAARGVPSDPDGYQFGEDVALSDEAKARVKEIAATGKYTNAQAQQLAGVVQELENQGRAIQEQKKDEGVQNMINYLSDEWGHPDTKSYAENFNLTQYVLEQNGISPNSPAADSIWSGPPQVIKMINELGKMLDPTQHPAINQGDLMTPKSAEAKLQAIAADMNKAETGSQRWKELDNAYNMQYKALQRIKG